MMTLTMMMIGIAVLWFTSLTSASAVATTPGPRAKAPQILAHRGACGYVPEHSLAAYQLAIDLETDYIEPDLCLTSDGVFIAMHDLLLDDTTNVNDLPQFAEKKTTKVVDGKDMTGYFVSDFTLAELSELRLKQRLAGRSTQFDYLLSIPTFDQIMALAESNFNTSGRTTGLYVELKHPSYYASLGFDMPRMLLAALTAGGYAIKSADASTDLRTQVLPVVIQCFESATLQTLHDLTDIPLVLLIDKPVSSQWTKTNLQEISKYASGVGPEKSFFTDTSLSTAQANVDIAHTLGLAIHPWTFRQDSGIEAQFHGNFTAELSYFYCCLGMDALFTEFPDVNREILATMARDVAQCKAVAGGC